MASYTDVLEYLSALDYPAGTDDVVREAEREGAPLDYANGNEVARSAGIDAAPELSAAQRSAQARDRHPRVSQHLRRI